MMQIESCIYTVRELQVMLDSDLAQLYQTETRYINRAVKRNPGRFPVGFSFQLTAEEWAILRCQTGTLKAGRGQHRKYAPRAFTEQGVAMLSAILDSEVAIRVSVQVMQAFIALRAMIAANRSMFFRLEDLEQYRRISEHKFEKIFRALESRGKQPQHGIFFEGQVFDAYAMAANLVRTATATIVLIDNYMDETTLTLLSKKQAGVKVYLLSSHCSNSLVLDVQRANTQYGGFELHGFTASHDRFLLIDKTELYHLGASLKDLGKKWFAFSKMDRQSVAGIMNAISRITGG